MEFLCRPTRPSGGSSTGDERINWYLRLGIRPDHLRLRAHEADELSHYSSGTSDVEYLFPIGWSELEGIANRGDFDLTQHAAVLGRDARVLRPATGERYVPHVIEPAAGADRAMLAFLVDAYDEEEIERRDAHRAAAASAPRAGQGRDPAAAPEDGQPELAREVYSSCAARAGRVRRRRRDRPPLPPPGRDRYPVVRHDRPQRSRTARSPCETATPSPQIRMPIAELAGEIQRRPLRRGSPA